MNIFLDFDGVLVDNFPRFKALHTDLAKELDFAPMNPESYWDLKKDCIPEREILHRCDGINEQKIEQYLRLRFERIEDTEYLKQNLSFPDSIANLEQLKKIGDLHLVTTRSKTDQLIWEIKNKNFYSYFKKVLVGADESIPAWQKKKSMIEESGIVLTGHDIIIGDTEAEILCGQALKIKAVAVLSGIRSEEKLKGYNPNLIFSNLAQAVSYLLNQNQPAGRHT